MRAAVLALAPWLVACSIGEGKGDVESERLFMENCWSGPFDLKPNFFAANPFENTLIIRIQRGEQSVETSDGVIIIVHDVKGIREQLGASIQLGLPVGVSPPGIPEQVNLNPPQVSLSIYLYNTCHVQNAALYSVGGTIQFDSLFSGDPNEDEAEDLLTEASFEAVVVDPRDVVATESSSTGEPTLTYPEERMSTVTGNFRFYFQRGVPAQPFP